MDQRQNTAHVGRIRGIGIYVHYSWLVIAGLILLGFWGLLESEYPTLSGPTRLLLVALGTTVFFGSVLVHELAHALVARRRGFEVKGITLYLFGGATEADASSRTARDEFVVAIAGPLTSLALAGALAAAAVLSGGEDGSLRGLLFYLGAVNLMLALFNLAPGLPLDGGRVFRSIVWGVTGDFARATRWATTGGVVVGYLLMSIGLLLLFAGSFGGLWLIAIGWMISQSARQTGFNEGLRSEFNALVAADIMSSPVITIPARASIATAVREYFAKRTETAFPVVDDDRICGLLSVAAVRSIPASEIWKTTAGQVALRFESPVIVNRSTPMTDVISMLGGGPAGTMRALVVEDDNIVGIISPSDIMRRHTIADLVEPALTESVRR